MKIARAGEIDLAIVDCHLRDGIADDLASSLRSAGIPFISVRGTQWSNLERRSRARLTWRSRLLQTA